MILEFEAASAVTEQAYVNILRACDRPLKEPKLAISLVPPNKPLSARSADMGQQGVLGLEWG